MVLQLSRTNLLQSKVSYKPASKKKFKFKITSKISKFSSKTYNLKAKIALNNFNKPIRDFLLLLRKIKI